MPEKIDKPKKDRSDLPAEISQEEMPAAEESAAEIPSESAAPAGQEEIASREREMESLRREAADFKDKYFRAAAEIANARKRLDREKAEYYESALAGLFKELLTVLDNLERALGTGEGEKGSSLGEGVALIHKQILAILLRHGVTPIDPDGPKFDPRIHQALITEESADVSEPEVGEVLQKGYRLNDRLFRPAIVKVLIPPKE